MIDARMAPLTKYPNLGFIVMNERNSAVRLRTNFGFKEQHISDGDIATPGNVSRIKNVPVAGHLVSSTARCSAAYLFGRSWPSQDCDAPPAIDIGRDRIESSRCKSSKAA